MSTMISRFYISALLMLLAALLALASLGQIEMAALPLPILWISMGGVAVLIGLSLLFRPMKGLLVIASAALALFAVCELIYAIIGNVGLSEIESGGDFHWVPHEDYGYVAPPGTFTESKTYQGKPIYNVSYSMNEYGHRLTRSTQSDLHDECILVFGDGYTFGWGLQDAETTPWQLAKKLGTDYKVINMAFLTHGPHQMLAQLESAEIAECGDDQVTHVVYLATPDQARRAAGLRVIDHMKGPRYLISGNDGVVRTGRIGSLASRKDRINSILYKSMFYRGINGGNSFYLRGLTNEDVRLYTAILGQAKQVAAERFPGSAFLTVTWSGGDKDDKEIVSFMEQSLTDSFGARRTRDLIADLQENYTRYTFGEYSIHPNALANGIIAGYLAAQIDPSTPTDD